MKDMKYIVRTNEPFKGFVYDICRNESEFNSEGGKFKIINEDEYNMLIENFINEMQGPYLEINEDRFNDMLNCLPPRRWNRLGYYEFFFMSEMTYAHITSIFARVGNKYYTTLRPVNMPQDKVMAELKALEL